MEMIYDSESFCVMRFEMQISEAERKLHPAMQSEAGYEIVDKWGRKEIFINGDLALHFQDSVQELISQSPSTEEIDDYLEQFSSLMQQPVALH
jgi:hypothetical protein